MGPLPHDHHRVAAGNSHSLQAEAAPRHARPQAPRATAGTTPAGGSTGAAATAVTAWISDNQGNRLQRTPAFGLGLGLRGHLLEEAQEALNS